MATLSDVDQAWLAGLYEGEGCAGVGGRGVVVEISMTDADVLLRVQSLFPSPQGIVKRDRGPGRKPIYQWRLRRRAAVAEFLNLVLPLLCARRTEQARVVIARATDGGGLGSGHRRKTICRNGHPYTLENTHINVEGHRNCRTCRRNEARKRRSVAAL